MVQEGNKEFQVPGEHAAFFNIGHDQPDPFKDKQKKTVQFLAGKALPEPGGATKPGMMDKIK